MIQKKLICLQSGEFFSWIYALGCKCLYYVIQRNWCAICTGPCIAQSKQYLHMEFTYAHELCPPPPPPLHLITCVTLLVWLGLLVFRETEIERKQKYLLSVIVLYVKVCVLRYLNCSPVTANALIGLIS